MNKQKPGGGIEWAHIVLPDGTVLDGYTWNPVGGCLHACRWFTDDTKTTIARCYAEDTAETTAKRAYPQGFDHHYWRPHLLDEPLKMKRRCGIFMDSMSDFMGTQVPSEQIDAVLDVVRRADWHIFQLLTKNAPRLLKFSYPDNLWAGVSTPPDFMFGKQLNDRAKLQYMSKALDVLQRVDAPVRWISAEPLNAEYTDLMISKPGAIDWMVIGATSNRGHYTPPDEDNLHRMLAFCDKHGIPVFFKGNMSCCAAAHYDWRSDFPQVTDGIRAPKQGMLM